MKTTRTTPTYPENDVRVRSMQRCAKSIHTVSVQMKLWIKALCLIYSSSLVFLLASSAQAADIKIFLPIVQGGGAGAPMLTEVATPSSSNATTDTLSLPPSPTPTVLPTVTETATPVPTPTATATVILTPTGALDSSRTGPEVIYISTSTAGSINDLTFGPEDIIKFDTTTNEWSLFFDGSDVGTVDLDAMQIDVDGSLLLSFHGQPFTLPGIAQPLDPTDIVRFHPTSLGEDTRGTFELYFDGPDVGLENKNEDVDGIAFDMHGRLLLSINGTLNVAGSSTTAEDLIRFTPTNTGENTSGSWDLFFDGADVGLDDGTEDLESIWFDVISNAIYLTTRRDFAFFGGLTGDSNDIVVCSIITSGEDSNCFFSLYWDGDAHGLSGKRIDALDFGGAVPMAPTPIPTPTPAPLALEYDTLYFIFATAGSTGNVAHTPQDIVAYNRNTNEWYLAFDGSDVGIMAALDAFTFEEDGTILLSLSSANTLPGLTTPVEGADIVRFIPTSLGANTAGNFALVLDGSSVGLENSGENIDSISWTPASPEGKRLIISTTGSYRVAGLTGSNRDLIFFDSVNLAEPTSGTWKKYFDGADIGLDLAIGEDIHGTWIDPASGAIYFTTGSNFTLYGNLSGDRDDIVLCMPVVLGETTICGLSLFLEGDAHGIGDKRIDGFAIGKSLRQ